MSDEYITPAQAALQERLIQLELALENQGWVPLLTSNTNQEFSREGLRRVTELARLNYIKNPLIKRGVDVQSFYVFGRGVNIGATDDQIKELVDAFLRDTNNQQELTNAQSRKARDKELRIDGNLFFALFVHPQTGNLRVGTIPFDEIEEIIRDPQNRKRTWYYKRIWRYDAFNNDTGEIEHKEETRYYRDFRYSGGATAIGKTPVDQDCVIYQVKTGAFADWAFGVSEVYAALDWAQAYKSFLEDYAKIVKSLARFAWTKKTGGGARGVAAIKRKLNSTVSVGGAEGNPSPVAGAINIEGSADESLTPIKTAQSTTASSEGKELRMMSGIAMGLPDHIASGDTAQGTLATAKSLDRPTEFQFVDRQELWINIYQTIIGYALYHAVVAPKGPLRGLGTPTTNEYEEPVIDWGDVDTTILVDFPPIIEQDVLASMQALIAGATFDGKTPSIIHDPKLLARQVMVTLGWDDVDRLTELLYPEGYDEPTNEPALKDVQESLQELLRAINAESL